MVAILGIDLSFRRNSLPKARRKGQSRGVGRRFDPRSVPEVWSAWARCG
jgi:hypothetical protein